MAKADLDRSQLDRSLLGDLAALIAVHRFLEPTDSRQAKVHAEIEALVNELWPTE